MDHTFEFDAVIHEIPEKGGAYIIFPWNIKEVFGKGRVKVTRPLMEFHTMEVL